MISITIAHPPEDKKRRQLGQRAEGSASIIIIMNIIIS